MDTLKSICLGTLILLSWFCAAQEEDAILWDASRPLSWSDFKGKPFKTAWAAATTASGISYEFNSSERESGYELHFRVYTYFYPEKSWYQPKLCDEVILSHEQLHFDISELYARKMRKILTETTFTSNVKEEVQAIYHRILKELSAFQDRYDKETNFSRNLQQQEIWNMAIKKALLP